jgi:hypothetical protein
MTLGLNLKNRNYCCWCNWVYFILVEFLAILFSGPISFLYIPFKGVFSLLFYPLKLLDFWFCLSLQRDRIPAGYYAIGKKNL